MSLMFLSYSCSICLETDRTDEINKFIKSEIDSMICARDLPDTAVTLLVDKPKCSNFYVLPKIH